MSGLGGGYFLIGLIALLLISITAGLISRAVSALRRTSFAAPSGPFVERLATVYVTVQLAFLAAVLLLLVAWLAAAAVRSGVGAPLLQALLLTLVVSALTTMSVHSILNFARAIQGQTGVSAAP